MVWATIADVKNVTGREIEQETLSIARDVIEMKTGLIEAVERRDISQRDLYWLRQAVCYQAAWVDRQPDLLDRNDVTGASQDGQSTQGNPDWLTLAPLARAALKRLSWRGSRTLKVSGAMPGRRMSPLISDAGQDFRPMA